MSRDEVIKYLTDNKRNLKRSFHFEKIGLFGSVAKNEMREESDIDLIVYGENIKTEELKYFLEAKFQKKVDIVRESTLYHFMRYLIEQETIYV